MIRGAVALAAALVFPAMTHAQGAKVYAESNLRAPFEEASTAFSAYRAGSVAFEFGPSGVLKDRLARGEPADLFASADIEHLQSLAQAGKSGPMKLFARNRQGAEYGFIVMKGASPTGNAFANFLLGAEGQRILAAAGYSPPGR
jgi:ABC-type molybdate transport system substrate-binding protein